MRRQRQCCCGLQWSILGNRNTGLRWHCNNQHRLRQAADQVCVGHAGCSLRPWQHLCPGVSGPTEDHPMVVEVRGEPPQTETLTRTCSSYAPVYLPCSRHQLWENSRTILYTVKPAQWTPIHIEKLSIMNTFESPKWLVCIVPVDNWNHAIQGILHNSDFVH